MMCGFLLDACMKLGHAERDRKGVYGLGGVWRIVWCMVIGAIGGVKVLLCVIVKICGQKGGWCSVIDQGFL